MKGKYRFEKYIVQDKGKSRDEEVLEHGEKLEDSYSFQNWESERTKERRNDDS